MALYCMLESLDRIAAERTLQTSNVRLEEIFRAMAQMMQARSHEELVSIIRANLPQVFGYEFAAILFFEKKEGNLYAFVKKDSWSTKSAKLMLPCELGITGVAIKERRTMFFAEGEDDPNYQLQVDNTRQILDYGQALVCPLYDPKGSLCGCLTLINKISQETTSEKDEQDLGRISPSIAEMINLLDVQREVTEISANLNTVMDDVRVQIDGFDKGF